MSFLSSLFGIQTQTDDAVTILDAHQFRAAVYHKDVQLIDVRTADEFHAGHIEGAINIDFFSSTFKTEIRKFNTDQAIYVYCRSGSRSKKSAKKLSDMGFKDIYDLKGGFLAYN